MNVHLTQFNNIIEHQKNAFGRKEMSLNKVLTFMSTMQQTALRSDYFEQNMSGGNIEVAGEAAEIAAPIFIHSLLSIHSNISFVAWFFIHSPFIIYWAIYHPLCKSSSTARLYIHCKNDHPLCDYTSTVEGWNCNKFCLWF